MQARWLAMVTWSLVVGCGGSRARTGAIDDTPKPCPVSSFADITDGASCSAVGTECAFPEGRCWCGSSSYCGGVAPSEEMLAALSRSTWQCEAARTDGCPQDPPSGACDEPGKRCQYGDCCVQPFTCEAGAWVAGMESCPP